MMSSGAREFTLPEAARAQGIEKSYLKDSILHHQADPHDHVCFVQSGRAFATAIDIDGNEGFVTEYSVGQFMGCEGLFERTPSKYQIVAKTPLTGILFSRDVFIKLMNDHPSLNNIVIADLTRQVRNYATQTLEANSLSVQGRIAAELHRQARPIGKSPDIHIIRPTPVFSELAQRMGSSRETVSRAVSKLVKSDILQRKTGALIVPDLTRLAQQIK